MFYEAAYKVPEYYDDDGPRYEIRDTEKQRLLCRLEVSDFLKPVSPDASLFELRKAQLEAEVNAMDLARTIVELLEGAKERGEIL